MTHSKKKVNLNWNKDFQNFMLNDKESKESILKNILYYSDKNLPYHNGNILLNSGFNLKEFFAKNMGKKLDNFLKSKNKNIFKLKDDEHSDSD